MLSKWYNINQKKKFNIILVLFIFFFFTIQMGIKIYLYQCYIIYEDEGNKFIVFLVYI
jgi:hypothetical protein